MKTSSSRNGRSAAAPSAAAGTAGRSKTAAAGRPGSGMTVNERTEFVRTWKRELAQRSDAGSASARSSAAAAAASITCPWSS
jgi:hypothetical protein